MGATRTIKTNIQNLKNKLGMHRMSKLTVAWWSIWYFRNQIIFNNNISWNIKTMAEFIKRQHHSWNQAKKEESMDKITKSKDNKGMNTTRKQIGIQWEKPDRGWCKINFDGSLNKEGSASIGYIIRDHNGKVITMNGESITKKTVVGAEAATVSKGISEAKRLSIKDIIIE